MVESGRNFCSGYGGGGCAVVEGEKVCAVVEGGRACAVVEKGSMYGS